MATTISEADFAARLREILDRVAAGGEHFVIERDGARVATLTPAGVPTGVTMREIVARVGDLAMPGDGFADDLETIHAAQGLAKGDDVAELSDGNQAQRDRTCDGHRGRA